MVRRYKILILFLIAFSVVSITSAHPGRTDEYGCHTCRTNCERWGLSYGEYHCHKPKGLPQPKREIKSRNNKLNKNNQKFLFSTTTQLLIPTSSSILQPTTNLNTTTYSSIYITSLKNYLNQAKNRLSNLKTKLDNLKYALKTIESNYLNSIPNGVPGSVREFLIAYKNVFYAYLDSKINPLLQEYDKILQNYEIMTDISETDYLQAKQNIELLNSYFSQIDAVIPNMSKSLNNFETLITQLNELYTKQSTWVVYLDDPMGNYKMFQDCQSVLYKLKDLTQIAYGISNDLLTLSSQLNDPSLKYNTQEIFRQFDKELSRKIEEKTTDITVFRKCY